MKKLVNLTQYSTTYYERKIYENTFNNVKHFI
jgi:hypothetical protein